MTLQFGLNRLTTTKQKAETRRSDWSIQSKRFVEHWLDLRGEGPFTDLQSFLDSPSPELQPQVFMFELEGPTKTVFRLMATDLVTIWGGDFTGKAAEDVFTPEVAAFYFADPRKCVDCQCGLWERGLFGETRNREIELEMVYLPLAIPNDKPERLAGLLGWKRLSTRRAKRRGLIAIEDRQWIDIGFGVPNISPEIFSV